MDNQSRSRNSRPAPVEVIFRRFFREVQLSRILSEAKKRRFFSKDINRVEKRIIAKRKTYVKKLKRGY